MVRYDGVSDTIEFDASAASVPDGAQTNAVTLSNGGNLGLCFDTPVELGGTTCSDEDLVEFDGISISSFFDGSSAGLDSSYDIDGAHVFASGGNLAFSFDTGGSLGGVDFDDEDVPEYDPIGASWEMAWDASVERTEWPAGADVNAVYFLPEPSPLLTLISGCGLLARLWSRRQRISSERIRLGRGQVLAGSAQRPRRFLSHARAARPRLPAETDPAGADTICTVMLSGPPRSLAASMSVRPASASG